MLPILRALSRELDAQVEEGELRGLAKNAIDGAWLLLALAGLYLLTPGAQVLRPGIATVSFGLFAVYALLLRFLPQFRRETRLKIGLSLLGMVAFITAFLFTLETHPGALLILYMLPVIIGALTLGQMPTLVITLLSVCGFLAVAALRYPGTALTARELVELGIALAPFLLVSYITSLLAYEINAAKHRITMLSETDELTGLANLRAFARLHRQEHERAARTARAYSVVIMDLNGLKQINDTYGHEVGNRAIVLFANVIARLIRSTDAAARYGGDEFIALLSEADEEQARRVIHRIRSAVERCTMEVGGRMIRLSVSIGAASFPTDAEEARELIVMADQAMYRDKRARRPQPEENEAPSVEVV